MPPNAIVVAMVDRMPRQVDRLQATERTLDFRGTFVGLDNLLGVHLLLIDAAANNVEPVERGLFANRCFRARVRKRLRGDRQVKVFRHLVFITHSANTKVPT